MKITIEFSIDNASWEDNPRAEVSYILGRLQAALDNYSFNPNPESDRIQSTPLMDINGNTIGTITLEVE